LVEEVEEVEVEDPESAEHESGGLRKFRGFRRLRLVEGILI
jgi:hypothetical protein